MKTFVALSLLLTLVATVSSYDSPHENLDVDAIVADKDQLQAFLDCFTDKKPCNELTQDFKNKMPEVLREACAKCSPIQKKKLRVLLEGMNKKLPVEFGGFKKTVDPDGKLFAALDAELAKA